jgi:D-alanine-D-alanine ligase
VGSGVLGSAVGMDKDIMKRLFRESGIPTADFLVFHETDRDKINFEKIKGKLGIPFFVKPANMGSSVGINKIKSKKEFGKAVAEAFQFDRKVIIEKNISGREIECAVLGNEKPIASIPGEVIPQHEFYSYDAKYIDADGALLKVPAKLPDSTIKKIQEMAVKVFKVLNCEGMGRVDLFLLKDGKIYANEINTIPGFTKISMYPKLWEASGISYANLIDKLIQLAIERFEKEKKLKTSYN